MDENLRPSRQTVCCALEFLPTEAPILILAFLSFILCAVCFGNIRLCAAVLCGAIALTALCGLFKRLRFLLPLLLIFALLCLSVLLATKRADEIKGLDGQTVRATFTVTEDSEEVAGAYSAAARVRSQFNGNFRVRLYSQTPLSCGKTYSGTLSLYASKYDSGIGNGIFLSARPSGSVTKTGGGIWYYRMASAVRAWIRTQLSHYLVAEESATLLALTVGDKSQLTTSFSAAVQNSGVSHIMVVSGMHLSIIMGALLFVMQPFRSQPFLSLLLTFFSLFFICAVCGFTKSILRAGCTFAIAALAPIFQRTAKPIAALSLAVVLILFAEPYTVYSVAFRLSVFSTFGILTVFPLLYEQATAPIPKRLQKFFDPVAGILLCSLSALWMTFPTSVRVFGFISLTALPTNLLISFAVTVALILILIALFLSVIPFLRIFAAPFYYAAGIITKYINHIILKLGTEKAVRAVSSKAAFLLLCLSALLLMIAVFVADQGDYLRRLFQIKYGLLPKKLPHS